MTLDASLLRTELPLNEHVLPTAPPEAFVGLSGDILR